MSHQQIKEIVDFDINRAVRDYSKFLEQLDAEAVLENLLGQYIKNFDRITDLFPEDGNEPILIGHLQDYSINMVKLWKELKRLHASDHFEFNLDNPFRDELYKSDEEIAEMIFGK